MASITAANSVYMLSLLPLFAIPQQLQGFSADDVFGTEAVQNAEVMMGVDGHLSGGFVYAPIVQNITLQADSKSNDIFDAWNQVQFSSLETLIANAVILLPSLGRKWTMTRGFLTSFPPLPDAKKVLQPRRYAITWERQSPAPA